MASTRATEALPDSRVIGAERQVRSMGHVVTRSGGGRAVARIT
ncbi:hypothetical protein QQY24_21880 [Streptomyces sp. TG1A-8]|nr:hypothetical protein [Streptomyces sp. TG1A-8]MDO0927925.1 hypothetical protein [Streptomyces sp. TG1A-8]